MPNEQPGQAEPKSSDADLQQQRESIRRGLQRANTAAVAILLVVIALAVSAIVFSQRTDRQRARAEAAERDVRQRLYESRLAEARAERSSGRAGRRARALDAVRAAGVLRAQLPGVDALPLRNEAIASLAASDIEPEGALVPLPDANAAFDVDATLENLALGHTNGEVTLHHLHNAAAWRKLDAPFARETNQPIDGVWNVLFAPSGGRLAAIYNSGRVAVFDVRSNTPAVTFSNPVNRVLRAPVQFSVDGRWLGLMLAGGRTRVFDLERSGALHAQLPQRGAWALAFHPATNAVAIADFTKVQFVDFAGRPILPDMTNLWWPEAIAFRPDGAQLASVNGQVGLAFFNVSNREPLRLRGPTGTFYSFGYDGTGDWFTAAVGDGVSRIWDARTGELRHRLDSGRIICFARDGTRFAWWRPGEGIGLCRFANQDSFREFRWQSDRDYHRRFWSVDFSEDGRRIAAADNENLVIWDASSGRVVHSVPGPRRLTVIWSRKHQSWLTSGDGGIALYPMTTEANGETRLGALRNITVSVTRNLGQSALSPDGHTLGIVTTTNTGWLIDLDHPEKRVRLHFPGRRRGDIGHLAFSPDGKLVTGSSTEGDALIVWSTATGELLRTVPGPHSRAAFRSDGKQLVLGSSQEYRLWNAQTWEPMLPNALARENLGGTTGAAAYSPDATLLAIAPRRELVQLIDPDTGRELASLTAPEPQAVSWMRFNQNGSRLAVATFDGAVRVWNIEALRQQLGAFGIAWEKDPANALTAAARVQPNGNVNPGAVVMLPLLGVALALGFAIFAYRRHRRLLDGYLQVDRLASERARALEAAQAEIAHSQKMKALGTLAAGIAHDFNNLLSVVRMSNKLIARDAKTDPGIIENTDEIEHAVQQGKAVVRSMLGYSRDSADEPVLVSVPELVEDTVGLLSRQFLSGITLNLQLDRDAPQVRAARSKLEQILLNLIVNASESMNGKGMLEIVVRRGAGGDGAFVLRPKSAAVYVEIVVADSGPGIGSDVLPRIFEPFFTTKTLGTQRGTGLGLSLVHTLAEQEGLGIRVRTAVGQGTAFHVVIPVGENDSVTKNATAGKESAG